MSQTIVSTQEAAAEALNVSVDEFKRMRDVEGFPGRPGNYDVEEIRVWLRPDLHPSDRRWSADEAAASEKTGQQNGAKAKGALPVFGIEVPYVEPDPESYIALQRGRLEVKLDREKELPGFLRIHAGLRAANAQFPDGKPVASAADVVRYLFLQATELIACVSTETPSPSS